MARDERVFLIGEDIGVYGGAFKVTDGLIAEFGEERVIDTPIAETAIVGAAIGAAMMGMRPVAEMQFIDFISCAFDMITNFAAKTRYRCGRRRSARGSRTLRRRRPRRPVSLAEPRGLLRAHARA